MSPLSAPLKLRPSTRGPSISHSEAATGAPGVRGQAAANGNRSASSSGASFRYCEPAALLLEPSFAPAVCGVCRHRMQARLGIARLRVYSALEADYEWQGGSIRRHY